MITISNTEEALKQYYLDAFSWQLNANISPFFNAIEKTSKNITGRSALVSIARGTHAGVAAINEDDELPAPHKEGYFMFELELKNIYGTIELTDKIIRSSANSAGAVVNVLNAEMEGLIAGAKSNFARMLYGDGNGYLCSVVSKVDSNNIKVTNVKNYFEGMNVTISSSPNIQTRITSVDTEAGTIKVYDNLASVTLEGGEAIRITGAFGNELLGLGAIFDGSAIYGFSKSITYFNPLKRTCALDDLTEDDLLNVIDTLEETAEAKPTMILCSHKVRRKIASIVKTSRTFVNTTDIASGYSNIVINGVPVYADKYCPDDKIYFLNTDDFMLSQLCDWSWLEDDGGRILKQIPNKAAYRATLVKYAQLICRKPFGQGAIVLT